MTIEDILSREEGQTFDRKSVRIKPKDLAVTMIAFANADGGDLVVGITDGKKEIEGVDGDEKVLNEIRRTPFDFCVPSVNAQVEMVPCVDRTGKANHVLVFHIEPSLRVYANQADGLLPIKYYKNDFILRAVAWSKTAKDAGSDKVAIK